MRGTGYPVKFTVENFDELSASEFETYALWHVQDEPPDRAPGDIGATASAGADAPPGSATRKPPPNSDSRRTRLSRGVWAATFKSGLRPLAGLRTAHAPSSAVLVRSRCCGVLGADAEVLVV